MKLPLMTLLCAVALLGCAKMRQIELQPAEADDSVAGMSGSEPSVEPMIQEAIDPACESMSRLAARDGTIAFNDDGSATITVSLANESDEGVYDYPGLAVYWEIPQRYAGGNGDLFLYGLAEHDSFEHTLAAPAEMLQWGSGQELVVHATPFTLATRDSGANCEATELVFSASIP